MKADKKRIKTDKNSQKWSKTFFLNNFVNYNYFSFYVFYVLVKKWLKADKNRIKTDRNSQKWSKTFFLYNFVNITIFTIFTFHSMFSMFWSNSNKLIFSVLKVLRLGFVIETCSKTSELFLICPFLRENLSTSSCTLFLFTETWFLGDLRLGIALNLS